MRFSRLIASTTLLASAVMLNTAAYADRPSVDTPAPLSAVMNAQVFPFGAPQGFKVLGDTKGKNCNFGFAVSLNGAYTISKIISAPLPWTSDDLGLPTSNGGNYTLFVQSVDGAPNACKGQATLTFAVVLPTITKLQAVAAPPGGAYRPNSNILYAGDVFQFDVSGNMQNTTGPNRCGYTVQVKNKAGQITNTSSFTEFNIWDAGVIKSPGEYTVHAIPYNTPGGSPAACLGSAEIGVTFYAKAAWVTGIKLVGFGYHFNGGDAAGMPQFCPNCDSIFSPPHNRAFLQIVPTIVGATPGGTCAYGIEAGADGGGYGLFFNGQPAVPSDQSGFNSPTDAPPYWNKYDSDSNTIAVTILGVTNFVPYPPCNVLGGKITKTITFTNNPALKVVK